MTVLGGVLRPYQLNRYPRRPLHRKPDLTKRSLITDRWLQIADCWLL